ncbi:MAG: cryptochrome/photolyase family protein [Pseudomonadota bacterium]
MRHLIVVLGDQLDQASAAFEGFDAAQDAIWMCEAPAEAGYVWSHKARLVVFIAAMRHFAALLRARSWPLHYQATGSHPHATLAEALSASITALRPQKVRLVEPGEWRLVQDFARIADETGVPFETLPDMHFITPLADFAEWMKGRKQPRLEHFYRWIRQRTNVLMEGKQPAGGTWNFDHDNREAFGKDGPQNVPKRFGFKPDAITREVIKIVETRYAEHPGRLAAFDWPLTREEALEALDDFIAHRLPKFGPHQDALWTGETWLWHSHLSAAINLKLLNPREVCEAAEAAWRRGEAPIESVEGFIRQIIGWREFVRGLYWHRMPQYLEDNALDAHQPLPAFYWSGNTDYACLKATIEQTLQTGYAHHIQRLMVTGLFALLLGVEPKRVHEWYLAVYVDAVEWVELPNVMGMSQFADGGFMGSKPYIASGKYIQRMSNYCTGCRYDPELATGPRACPFTTLYWDFIGRHERLFDQHPRLKPQVMNWQRKKPEQQQAIQKEAITLKALLSKT